MPKVGPPGYQPCLCLTSRPWALGCMQAGSEKRSDPLRVFAPVAVNDNGIQVSKTFALQQCQQCLVCVPVHGHGKMQVGGNWGWPMEARLFIHSQVLCHVTGSAACGCGCETQEAVHAHVLP